MKKSTWLLMIFLILTVSGISTSHAYSKNKHLTKEELNIKIIPMTLEETKESEEIDPEKANSTTVPKSKKKTKQTISKKEAPISSEENNYIEEIDSTFQFEIDTPIEETISEEIYEETPVNEVVKESVLQKKRNTSTYPDFSSGFNYLGYHYEIGHFTGFDYLPVWTNIVYQWTNFPNHYLIENQSYPGQTIFGLDIGSSVIIDGTEFHVYDILYNQPNDQLALENVIYSGASASIQVCASTNDDAELNLYFLK